jgi:hypothetical protein
MKFTKSYAKQYEKHTKTPRARPAQFSSKNDEKHKFYTKIMQKHTKTPRARPAQFSSKTTKNEKPRRTTDAPLTAPHSQRPTDDAPPTAPRRTTHGATHHPRRPTHGAPPTTHHALRFHTLENHFCFVFLFCLV